MKAFKIAVFVFFAAWLVLPLIRTSVAKGQVSSAYPGQALNSVDSDPDPVPARCLPGEARTGFDDRSIDTGFVSDALHHQDQLTFEVVDFITDGLGPVYNAQSCRECHQNTLTGGISQITELRAGVVDKETGDFSNPCVLIRDDAGNKKLICNRSLINDRAICPAGKLIFTILPNGNPFDHPNANIQERVDNIVTSGADPIPEDRIITSFRTSLNLLGDGLVECVNSNTFQSIANSQPVAQRGKLVLVELLETPDPTFRVGRFGWKNQQASLFSFSSDAYINEIGITNRLHTPNQPNNMDVTTVCDEIGDEAHGVVEDQEDDIVAFTRFMRATKAPPRAPHCEFCPAPDAQIVRGSQLFEADQMGCAVCHVRSISTDSVGTPINGGTFTIPVGLGCKTFHPFGDFLLHDIGTGDGIVQIVDINGNLVQKTANLMRTAPLWGVRTRDRLMHDGESLTFVAAIRRHHNQAQGSYDAFFGLDAHHFNDADRAAMIAFLKSL